MKMILKCGILLALTTAACNSESTTGQETAVDSSTVKINTPTVVDTTLSGCYSLIVNRDTASLQLQRKGNLFTGSLSYNLYEKDHNDGTFQGEVSNGILTGWYLFRSEGIMSVRQEVFKIGNNRLWPAQGQVVIRNDTAMYTNPEKLTFDTSRAFVKVQCVI
jgi:hypothetical protein